MSFIARFKNIGEAEKSKAVEKLIEESTPDFEFFFFITLSLLMATFGLLMGSTAIVIAAMLLAPILYPVLSFSLGIVMSDARLLQRSISTMVRSVVVGMVAVVGVTLLSYSGSVPLTAEIVARTDPSLFQFAVAVVAGFAVCYALVKRESSAVLPGAAVSLTLIPPLAVIGIGAGVLNWELMRGALLVFGVNVAGVMLAAIITFSIMNFHVKRRIADTTMDKEKKRMKEEEKKVQERKEENQKEEGKE